MLCQRRNLVLQLVDLVLPRLELGLHLHIGLLDFGRPENRALQIDDPHFTRGGLGGNKLREGKKGGADQQRPEPGDERHENYS